MGYPVRRVMATPVKARRIPTRIHCMGISPSTDSLDSSLIRCRKTIRNPVSVMMLRRWRNGFISEFYSEAAEVRQRTPRVSLSRLTADQLRQSLADLYASQVGVIWNVEERGLMAQYFDETNMASDKLRLERIDPAHRFRFRRCRTRSRNYGRQLSRSRGEPACLHGTRVAIG